MALRGNKMAADMGRTMTPAKKVEDLAKKQVDAVRRKMDKGRPTNPNRGAALKDALRINVDRGGASLKGVKLDKIFSKRSQILDSTKERDEKRAKAIGDALEKAKRKFIYTGTHTSRSPKRPKIEEA